MYYYAVGYRKSVFAHLDLLMFLVQSMYHKGLLIVESSLIPL